MATKTKEPVKELSPLEKIENFFEDYSIKANGLMDDYVAGPEMTKELNSLFQNLKTSIYLHAEQLQDKVHILEEDVKDLEQEVKSLEEDAKDKDKEIEEKDEKIEELEEGEHLTKQGYVVVKIDNMVLRDKLEHFIHTEIYPNYLDQQSFVTI